ncbi:hypothetical protein NQ318_011902 [Aromia moschata]|uniref:DUF4817 domain-containing protein n=1 Tax=Aromia moschata TaxID=1265417 RepID=A0AAV8YAZ9_9CUCU|nr:hypothetical protein NQ318_011902 [Aromia moschata]
MHKITILQMIGYGDRTRRQAEVVRLFREKYPELPPISQGTVSKIEEQFRECGHVRQLKKNAPNKLSDDQKLDAKLMFEENPHTSSRQTASALNISHSSLLRVLTENQMYPYKLVPTNELAKDDFNRRILFWRRGSVEWPARSPDLTPIVYKTKPDGLADLKRRITLAIRSITPQMLTNVRRHFYLHLGCCQDAGGMHFEHLLH